MKKNTFLTHLEVLTVTEVRKFAAYLHSTYPKSTVLLNTYAFYAKFHKKRKPVPELEVAYEKIFGKKPKSTTDIRNLQNGISDLFKKLKEYLVKEKIMASEFEKEFIWLQILEERNLHHQRNLHFKKLAKEEKKSLSLWSKVNELKLIHHELFRVGLEKENPNLNLIEEGIKRLDDFYFSLQLKYSAELLNKENLLSVPIQSSQMYDSFFTYSKNNLDKLSIQNRLYFYLNNFLKSPTQQQFQKIKVFLIQYKLKLHKDEKLITLLYLLNFLAKGLKEGNYNLRRDAFDLYKFGLEGEAILIHKKLLDHTIFRNVVNLSCHLKEYSWAEKFINDFQKYLDKSVCIENVAIAESILFFEKSDYKRVIQNIQKTRISGVFYVVMANIYILASKYELADTDNLDTSTSSFIRFVRRSKKLGVENKNAAINFAKILNHLIQNKLPKEKIQVEFKKSSPIYFGTWLEKKIIQYVPI